MPSPPADLVYYFDTNALWKFYQNQPGDLNTRRLVANVTSPVLISPLTMLEFMGVLMKYYRQGHLRRGQVRAVAKRLRRDVSAAKSNRPFRVVPLPDGAFRTAEGILLQGGYQYNTQTIDSLHLAVVLKLNKENSVALVTSDGSLQHITRRKNVLCYDPQTGELK